MIENHPNGTPAANQLHDAILLTLAQVEEIQKEYPHVADYRLTGILEHLRPALRLAEELAEGTTKELDAVRAQIANDPTHPMHTAFHGDENHRFLAQIKDVHADEWRTLRGGQQGYETAWDGLSAPMQRHGLRYGEIAGHIADMLAGDVLSAEDGTEFRVVKNGE